MQFLSMSRRRVEEFPPEAFAQMMDAESQRVKEFYVAGILRQIWVRGDLPGVVLIWEAASEDEVRAAIGTLPLFKAGMLELVALVQLKPFPGFGPA